MRRPEDQLRRMLEQTLVPPTAVDELDPDTIDAATSRWGFSKGNLAETYTVNSVLTPAKAQRIADENEIQTITDFYFTTAMSGYDRLAEQESRWLLPAADFPPAVRVLLQPVMDNPALTASLFATEVLFVSGQSLWRLVPNRPGAMLEGEFTHDDARALRSGLFQSDTESFTPAIFLVNHLGRSSYLTGDRSFRNSALGCGIILGAAWEHARASQLPMATTNTFIDSAVNRGLRCDGVERSTMAVILLPSEHDNADPQPNESARPQGGSSTINSDEDGTRPQEGWRP
ncbi:MAG: hypothetical protein ACTILB_13745 [Brevibacterium aurantiacum]|uniref:hypothetical protein n=1 Tax=Brevibacterium aurantiacum TaxID=273384 RepID=UPI00264C309A|nr:hypothetical protein [Brevibacterium sp.]